MDVLDLPRNDARAAVNFYKATRERLGYVPGDMMSILIQLQDNPAEFFALKEAEMPYEGDDDDDDDDGSDDDAPNY